MLKREEWLDLARKCNWSFSYIEAQEVYPSVVAGNTTLEDTEWESWEEPYKTTFSEYVLQQHEKDTGLQAVRELLSQEDIYKNISPEWLNGQKLYAATFTLAEFAAVIGNLRAARFGRDSAWRQMALLGALDELRHTQIPLLTMHPLLKWDGQFDWTHKFYHTNNWVAVAARHMVDELLVASDPIEFAIATNFVFETGFTNLQFIGLSSMAHDVRDYLFEKMTNSIQSDEARHAQIGPAVLEKIVQENKEYAQFVLDKWFWRSWIFFSIVTGFTMDYFTPLENRRLSFKEFMHEWVLDQFLSSLKKFGLEKPWYWPSFEESLDSYHHMVYLSAYTYRATVWFDFVVPGPEERKWLKNKYPRYWDQFEKVWQNIDKHWKQADLDNDFAVHGTAIVTFCNLCQIVLSAGTPEKNSAHTLTHKGRNYIFCSKQCQWIFEKQPERYENHKGIVNRVLEGTAPGNVVALIRNYFDLDFNTWGKDVHGGRYPWISSKEEPHK